MDSVSTTYGVILINTLFKREFQEDIWYRRGPINISYISRSLISNLGEIMPAECGPNVQACPAWHVGLQLAKRGLS